MGRKEDDDFLNRWLEEHSRPIYEICELCLERIEVGYYTESLRTKDSGNREIIRRDHYYERVDLSGCSVSPNGKHVV